MNRILICQIVPKDNIHLYSQVSQAANNFCYSILLAISPSKLYSIIPIYLKKKGSIIFKDPLIKPIHIRLFPQVSILRLLNVLLENIILIMKIIFDKERLVWFYNITKHNLICYFFLRFFTTKKCLIILADFNPPYKFFQIDNIISKLISKSNGIIALSNGVKSYVNNANLEVQPGIVTVSGENLKDKQISEKRNIYLFCGVLDDHTGIQLALDTFVELPEYELIVTGQGKYDNDVMRYSKKYKNIKYFGFLEFGAYKELLRNSDILLSLRNPNYKENESNFPSKIIEAMINRVLVISTYEYDTLANDTYFKSEYSQNSLLKLIFEIQKLPAKKLFNQQEHAYEYVMNNFSQMSWLKKIQQIESKA